MSRLVPRRSSLDVHFDYADATTTTVTHNYDLATINGKIACEFEIMEGDGYIDKGSITKDDFDVVSAVDGGYGVMRITHPDMSA